MNEIEAIAYFEKLIKYFEDKEGEPYWSEVHNSMSRQMITVALEALREQAERSKWCEFCKMYDFREASAKIDLGKYAHIYLAGGSYRFPENEQFRFCPMCGKSLEEVNRDG